MPFSPQSKFSVRAVLVDPAGKPRPELTVQARALQAGDKSPLPATVAGEAKSKELGQLEVPLASEVMVKNQAVPAIELWLIGAGEPQWIAGALSGVSVAEGAVVFDFGSLVVLDAPLAKLQERALFGQPQPLYAPLRALELKLAEATKAINGAKAALAQLTAERAALAQQVTELGASLETTKQALAQAQAERAALGQSLGLTQQALEQAGAERAELADKLAEREEALAQAQAELKVLGEEVPAELGAVVEGIGGQLKSARESLAGGAFALGRVSLDLKVVPSGGGAKVAFPTRGELKSMPHDVISSLSLDFAAVAPTRPVVRGDEKPKLPDLRGDTEVMARRRLAALDLGVKVGQQELAPEDVKRVGRVVKQVPAPGAAVAAGDVVTILLGKPSRKV